MSAEEMVAELERADATGLARFVDELQKHGELAEDLYDLLAFRLRAQEPARSFEEFVAELSHQR
jgi:hypothetical protein